MTLPDNWTHWTVGIVLMIFFCWLVLSAFTDIFPWKIIDPAQPIQKNLRNVMLAICGIGVLHLLVKFMSFVWMGLKHILLLDLPVE